MHGRSLSRQARVRLVTTVGLAAGLALVVASVALGGGSPPAPGTSQDNPITAVGPSATSSTFVDIYWPDGTTETVSVGNQTPSTALATRTLAEQTRAEHRVAPPTHGITPNASDGGGGSTACSWSVSFPWKASSTTVATAASVWCTVDVSSVVGSLSLFRSSNYTQIGFDYETGGRGAVWGTSGSCLSSTWQYNAELVYAFVSDVNGAHYPPAHWADPSWISC